MWIEKGVNSHDSVFESESPAGLGSTGDLIDAISVCEGPMGGSVICRRPQVSALKGLGGRGDWVPLGWDAG